MTQTTTPLPRLVALQHRDYRLFWFGQLISTIGSQMQLAAIDWHVYKLLEGTEYTVRLFGREVDLGAEALGLGSLGLVRIFPIFIFALLGGMLADTRDRRWLMVIARATAAIFSAILAIITFMGRDSVGAIYLLTAAGAAAMAFDNPARQSLVPNLVPREHLPNAVSLNTLTWHIGTIVGAFAAGALLGLFNIGLVYAFNVIGFIVVIITLLRLHYRPSERVAGRSGVSWSALVEGLRFTYGSRIIWGTMLLDFFATFFSSARTMLPIVAGEILKVGPQGFGLLRAAEPIGALLAGAYMSLRPTIRRQGFVLLASVVVYGVATTFFGISTIFAVSFILFALIGAADTISTVIRGTLRQLLTPDNLRGRMTSVNMLFFMGGPQLGELEAGLVGAFLGVPFAIVSGGIATVVLTAWVAWNNPHLRTYESEE
jgi:MFS family permease